MSSGNYDFDDLLSLVKEYIAGEGGTDGKDLPVCTCICMCGSVHDCGCVVDGRNDMAAS